MTFITGWLWYVAAFLGGSVLAWVITILTVRRTSAAEVVADLPNSRAPGGRR